MQVTTARLPDAPRPSAMAVPWLMRLIRKRRTTSDVHCRAHAKAAVHKGFLRSWELNGFKVGSWSGNPVPPQSRGCTALMSSLGCVRLASLA